MRPNIFLKRMPLLRQRRSYSINLECFYFLLLVILFFIYESLSSITSWKLATDVLTFHQYLATIESDGGTILWRLNGWLLLPNRCRTHRTLYLESRICWLWNLSQKETFWQIGESGRKEVRVDSPWLFLETWPSSYRLYFQSLYMGQKMKCEVLGEGSLSLSGIGDRRFTTLTAQQHWR